MSADPLERARVITAALAPHVRRVGPGTESRSDLAARTVHLAQGEEIGAHAFHEACHHLFTPPLRVGPGHSARFALLLNLFEDARIDWASAPLGLDRLTRELVAARRAQVQEFLERELHADTAPPPALAALVTAAYRLMGFPIPVVRPEVGALLEHAADLLAQVERLTLDSRRAVHRALVRRRGSTSGWTRSSFRRVQALGSRLPSLVRALAERLEVPLVDPDDETADSDPSSLRVHLRGACCGGAADGLAGSADNDDRGPPPRLRPPVLPDPGEREERAVPVYTELAALEAHGRRHQALLAPLRAALTAAADDEQPEHGLVGGPELDLDALATLCFPDVLPDGALPVFMDHVPTNEEPDAAVVLLVDLSGSMHGARHVAARAAALALGDALHGLTGVAFEVLGFTTEVALPVRLHTVAKSFDDPWPAARSRVAGLAIGRENDDGAAVEWATARLLRRPASTRALLVLSDGRPYSGRYPGTDEDERRLEDAIRAARAGGVRVAGIGIASEVSRHYGARESVRVDRLEDLVPALASRLAVILAPTSGTRATG